MTTNDSKYSRYLSKIIESFKILILKQFREKIREIREIRGKSGKNPEFYDNKMIQNTQDTYLKQKRF